MPALPDDLTFARDRRANAAPLQDAPSQPNDGLSGPATRPPEGPAGTRSFAAADESSSRPRPISQADARAGGALQAPYTPSRPGPDATEPAVEPNGDSLPALRDGRYQLTAKLGSGGFGVVYRGLDHELQREVAVKVPHRHRIAGPRDVDAYLAEARSLASLDHPGIVPIYDVGRTDDGRCYLVSKFIAGDDLAARLRRGRLAHTESVTLIAAVADALHHAHQRRLVHRDIKPANILLDAQGRPVLVDFGLALREEDYGTGPTSAGTPTYMSPEQARGEGHLVDARTDVYSLGVVFYELLTGRRPFRSGDRQALVEQITTREPRPPRQRDDAIPKELDRICLKALSKRAADRYSTARDFAEDLRCWLAGPALLSSPAVPVPSAAPRVGCLVMHPTSGTESEHSLVQVVPRGLRSFGAEDADFFLKLLPGPCGRDGLPESLRFWKTRLEETDPDRTFRVGVIYGPSGCGKSSLVKAGLLPRLAAHIAPIYVEAAPRDTEARLLKGLRKQCPGLLSSSGLVESLTRLRRERGLTGGRKVVLVLDQFEQWLHAQRFDAPAELVQALRQCDGEHVQCVLLVRDDFWMSTIRFLREVEVPLLEGENSVAVDLFDVRHARRVLAAFGRAFGALPEGKLTAEQDRFLDQATTGLAAEGKIIPVRLSLFAEMVKGKPWTPATLKAVGGPEGIGVAFLEETFSAATAPPEHRLHQRAARAVLQALLPEPGSGIKGQMQARGKLLEVSGYARQPREFDEVLHLLDTELRLMTPTEDEGSPLPEQPYYQLTHDYLVDPLRQWLTRKQRETIRGRAELRLAERAAWWSQRPQKRHLPSWWEYGPIVLLARRPWTEPQRMMMAAATRHYAGRGLFTLGVLVLLTLAGFRLAADLEENRTAAQAHGLVQQLRTADVAQVPVILAALEDYRDWANPLLTAVADDPANSPAERLRANLGLLPVDAGRLGYVRGRLADASPDELLILRRLLRPWQAQLAPDLWRQLQEPGANVHQQLRLACLLAGYDPENASWEALAPLIVNHVVKENPLHLKQWVDALRPARRFLLAPLQAVFRDASGDAPERAVATSILVDYAADQPGFLAELIKDADARQFQQLIGRLEAYRDRVMTGLKEELAHPLPAEADDSRRERQAKRQMNAAVALYQLKEHAVLWPLLRQATDPRLRSYLLHALPAMGGDPEPLLQRWEQEADPSVRRALLLCLGEFAPDRLTPHSRQLLIAKVLNTYQTDPDPGLHSAAEWLLRQGDVASQLKALEEQLKGKAVGAWSVNREGHTMVVVDPGKEPGEFARGQRQDVRFALATKEVTVEQFLRFRPEHVVVVGPSLSDPKLPAGSVTWYDAAAYCRWLSEQEGIPENQMCYPPLSDIKDGMTPYPDFLRRTGYRLPTLAEAAFACRAGATTARFFGQTAELLPRYAWFDRNSGGGPQPVGLLKPNDFGLFDTLGNMAEWCQEAAKHGGSDDREDVAPVRDGEMRLVRGGAANASAGAATCRQQDARPPTMRWRSIGFRVARTLPALPGR